MQDPLARTLHPNLCRDGERSPMCWEPAGAGFTTSATPWLPLGPQPPGTDVATQRTDPASLLWLYKELLAMRRARASLHRGAYRTLETTEGVLAFERRSEADVARVALNFGDATCSVALGAERVAGGLHTRPGAGLPRVANELSLGPGEGAVLLLD
jgi:alpha-glucosidase